MATGADVLRMLIPTGGYIITGDEYEGIQFLECEPITKAKYEAGFAKFDEWKNEQEATKAAEKSALLNKLGINEDEARLLIG